MNDSRVDAESVASRGSAAPMAGSTGHDAVAGGLPNAANDIPARIVTTADLQIGFIAKSSVAHRRAFAPAVRRRKVDTRPAIR